MNPKKTRRFMGFVTNTTMLRIGIIRTREPKRIRYFVRSTSDHRRYPVTLGIVTWLLQLPCIMGVILTALAIPSAICDGKGIIYALGLLFLCIACIRATMFLHGLWELRPGWDKEDYIPSQQEIAEWDRYVHSEEEYFFLENWK